MRPVNLLPEQLRSRERSGRAGGAYIVIGALAALFVMVAVYALTANQVNSRKGDTSKAQAETQRHEARTAALGPFGDFAQTKEMRLASVRELAGGRFDWERFMRELALVLPSGSWISEVDASTTGTQDSTGQGNGEATGQPSAKLTGCAPKQSDTAKLMVRLRRMSKVDDVKLTESAQESDSGQPTLTNCGKLYGFDLVVSFVAADPADGTDKKQKAVPARLGGGL